MRWVSKPFLTKEEQIQHSPFLTRVSQKHGGKKNTNQQQQQKLNVYFGSL